jgi:hypothetical protein
LAVLPAAIWMKPAPRRGWKKSAPASNNRQHGAGVRSEQLTKASQR